MTLGSKVDAVASFNNPADGGLVGRTAGVSGLASGQWAGALECRTSPRLAAPHRADDSDSGRGSLGFAGKGGGRGRRVLGAAAKRSVFEASALHCVRWCVGMCVCSHAQGQRAAACLLDGWTIRRAAPSPALPWGLGGLHRRGWARCLP